MDTPPPPPPLHHPDTLVALATAYISFTQIPGADRGSSQAIVIPETDKHLILFLDALAALSVSEPVGQIVAIGVVADEDLMTLTVAENGTVNEHLRDHLMELLSQLKEISLRELDPRPELEFNFYITAYAYSFAKLRNRFRKSEPWLARIERALQGYRGRQMQTPLKHVVSALLTAHGILNTMFEMNKEERQGTVRRKLIEYLFEPRNPKRNHYLERQQLVDFIKIMTGAAFHAQALLSKVEVVDKWAMKFTLGTHAFPPFLHFTNQPSVGITMVDKHGIPRVDKNNKLVPFPLYRAIEKLTSFHRHIMNLISFAIKWRGARNLANFKVVVKDPEAVVPTITYPSRVEMGRILHNYVPGNPVAPYNEVFDFLRLQPDIDTIRDKMNFIVLDDNAAVTCAGIVHCECALIAMYNQDLAPSPDQPVTYIGVSKLSCAACWAWIQAFNTTHKPMFHTRGTHGRWYSKWGMPVTASLQTNVFMNDLNAIVGATYRRHHDEKRNAMEIVFSDSTEAKGVVEERHLDYLEFVEIERLAQEHTNARLAVVIPGIPGNPGAVNPGPGNPGPVNPGPGNPGPVNRVPLNPGPVNI